MAAQFDYKRLAMDVREFMLVNNIKAKQFAELCGINESTLSRLLSGKSRYMTTSNVDKISAVLSLPMNYYALKLVSNYDTMSIDELNGLIRTLREIRDRKIEHRVSAMREKIAELETQLYEAED